MNPNDSSERAAYDAGRAAGSRSTRATLLPILVVACLIAALPCAVGGYVFLICLQSATR